MVSAIYLEANYFICVIKIRVRLQKYSNYYTICRHEVLMKKQHRYDHPALSIRICINAKVRNTSIFHQKIWKYMNNTLKGLTVALT